MAKLLYIEASPRKERSASIEVAKAFVGEYRKTNPGDTVDTLDLWTTPLPEFNGEVIDAKYAILHGQEQTPGQKAAWKAVEAVIERFKGADKYLFSLPMWNFGIPYKLKHYIDVLVQPTYTFSFSPKEGYKGLVLGKKAAVVYASSAAVYGSIDPGPGWLIWLAVAAVLNSALSLYYYARVIKYMYMDSGSEEKVKVPRWTMAAILIALFMTVFLGVFFDATVDVCMRAAEAFADLPLGL